MSWGHSVIVYYYRESINADDWNNLAQCLSYFYCPWICASLDHQSYPVHIHIVHFQNHSLEMLGYLELDKRKTVSSIYRTTFRIMWLYESVRLSQTDQASVTETDCAKWALLFLSRNDSQSLSLAQSLPSSIHPDHDSSCCLLTELYCTFDINS